MIIADNLQRLGEMEKAGELNPDLPANCFGVLMGAPFPAWRRDEYADTLWRMGAALGRFVYLLDAANDLKADIKRSGTIRWWHSSMRPISRPWPP